MSASVPGREFATALKAEPPEQIGANIRIGVRLVSSAVVFLFMAFTFAFWYLRALNSNHDFHQAGVNPPQGFGVAILVLVLLTAVVWRRARHELASDREQLWRSSAAAALGLGLIVLVLQIIEYLTLSWTTADGGLASVFWGWTLVFVAVWLGALYWMETLVAQTARRVSQGGPAISLESAEGCGVFLYTLALINVFGYVFLYLVK